MNFMVILFGLILDCHGQAIEMNSEKIYEALEC